MDKDKLVQIAEKLVQQDTDFDKIVNVLNNNCTDKLMVGEVISNLSPMIAYYEIEKNKRSVYRIYFVFSIFIFFIGLFYTIYSFISSVSSFTLVYGAILSGIVSSIYFWKKFKSPIMPFKKKVIVTDHFKRKF